MTIDMGYTSLISAFEEREKAKKLHDTIVDLSKELKWNRFFSLVDTSDKCLHEYAFVKEIITYDEYLLLKKYY